MKTKRTTSNRNTLAVVTARPLLVALVIAALAGEPSAPLSWGAEHPKELPKGTAKPAVALEDVVKHIETYVKQASKDGAFKVEDKKAGKQLSLTLDRVHRERRSAVGPDLYFVCADFKGSDGKRYDLDFFVQGTSEANLRVLSDKTSVHKEDGKERYTWARDAKKGIWEQKPVGTKAKEHPAPEHP